MGTRKYEVYWFIICYLLKFDSLLGPINLLQLFQVDQFDPALLCYPLLMNISPIWQAGVCKWYKIVCIWSIWQSENPFDPFDDSAIALRCCALFDSIWRLKKRFLNRIKWCSFDQIGSFDHFGKPNYFVLLCNAWPHLTTGNVFVK